MQGGSNQHGTHRPRRTTRTNHSPPRLELQEPAQRYIVSRALRETTKSNMCNPFLRGHSTTLGVGCGFLYFRSKAVLGLPVSTTSYSRHVVSTIQTRSIGLDNEWSLTDTDGAKHSPPSLQFLSCPPYSNIPYTRIIKTSYISRVTGNYSTSTESYLAWQDYRPTDTSIRLMEPRDCASKVTFNSYKFNAQLLN